jgi:hypothetical protein
VPVRPTVPDHDAVALPRCGCWGRGLRFGGSPQGYAVGQSKSLASQPGGQQLSPLIQAVIGVWQTAVQSAALPSSVSSVHGLPSSAQLVGQDDTGSQVSPNSTTPLSHTGAQSLSVLALHPAGQQLSPLIQAVIGVWQTAVQFAALPSSVSSVHASPSSVQLVGQDAGGSQVSPYSTAPLPQVTQQLMSLLALQLAGQHPSSEDSEQVVTGLCVQYAVQFAGFPPNPSMVQALLLLQLARLAGQLEGGSQVSPDSTVPLPQVGAQSLSTLALHPTGQQPSPEAQVTMAVWLQAALQVAELPASRSVVHALPSSQLVGHGHCGGSQVSLGSSIPLPHTQLFTVHVSNGVVLPSLTT